MQRSHAHWTMAKCNASSSRNMYYLHFPAVCLIDLNRKKTQAEPNSWNVKRHCWLFQQWRITASIYEPLWYLSFHDCICTKVSRLKTALECQPYKHSVHGSARIVQELMAQHWWLLLRSSTDVFIEAKGHGGKCQNFEHCFLAYNYIDGQTIFSTSSCGCRPRQSYRQK